MAVDMLFKENATWPELIKQIRIMSKADIFTAEKIALSHQGWRRRCNYWINHDRDCKKQAVWHIKHHGPNSLIAIVGEKLVITSPSIA
ncbi:hypothetical protein [Rhizobium leguminosarum]|uniref:hypothetical protein n=1 Tax=Rhizobium leguminosarum TaxID=384 RepID=UPI001559F1D5|nr:hypothetical protein [Rhizobium leguminosarum]